MSFWNHLKYPAEHFWHDTLYSITIWCNERMIQKNMFIHFRGMESSQTIPILQWSWCQCKKRHNACLAILQDWPTIYVWCCPQVLKVVASLGANQRNGHRKSIWLALSTLHHVPIQRCDFQDNFKWLFFCSIQMSIQLHPKRRVDLIMKDLFVTGLQQLVSPKDTQMMVLTKSESGSPIVWNSRIVEVQMCQKA